MGNKRKPLKPGSRAAQILIKYLWAHEISYAEAASKCGIDRSRFHRLLVGGNHPTLAEAIAIEAGYGVDPKKWIARPKK